MSSCICFICHNIVYTYTTDEYRDKYRELIGMNLTLDSHLCNICCHTLDKFWYFKSICLKRSYEYPVLFNERGTINLQKKDVEIFTMCFEDICNSIDNSIHFENKDDDFDIFNDHAHLPDETKAYDKPLPDQTFEIDDISGGTILNNDNEIHEHKINDGNDPEYTPHVQRQKIGDINELDEVANMNDDDYYEHHNDEIDNNDLDNYIKDNDSIDKPNNNDLDNYIKDNDSKDDKPKVKKKKKKKEFKKIILSVEEQKAELERNRKDKKYIEAEFKCYNCAVGFLFKDTYQAHMMRHEESNGEYRCDICTLRFASPRVLRAHSRCHGARHVCAACGRALRPRARAAHRARCWRRPPQAACHLCARLFRDGSALQQHLKRFHATSAARGCGVCGARLASAAAVRTHMIKHIQRKFQCEICPAIFSSPYTLTQHKKSHDPCAEVTRCEPCNKTFKNRKSLLSHRRNAKQHQEESFECPICSRTCANQRSLTHHIESIHSTTKNYACSRCSARYATEKALKRHVRGHDVKVEAKLAVCHLCGRSFKGKNKLNRHLREVCEKEKLEEQLSSYYVLDDV